MKIFNIFLRIVVTVFFSSATPNLFGSKKRREMKNDLAGTFKQQADDTQGEIDILKTKNPFESAAAKSAMTDASRKAKQTQQKFANIMGGNTNPEAIIASQQATQEAIAGTAGDISTGAEANKAAQLAQLRGEKAQQLGQSANIKQSAIDEQGKGWTDFFGALSSVGDLASGAAGVIGGI